MKSSLVPLLVLPAALLPVMILIVVNHRVPAPLKVVTFVLFLLSSLTVLFVAGSRSVS